MKYKKLLPFLFLVLLLLPSVLSLLSPGFFETDDGEWMVIRFSAFYQALSDGQFPVRFLGRLNFGYGYPVANFLYPGFMYLAVPIKLLGFSFVNSVKIIFVISMVGGGIFTFAWLSKVFDKTSALIGGVFYTYTPYHLFDLYKRGSVGEVLSLMWISFILWVIEEKNKLLISIGIFLLAISHNSLFLLFAPLLFVYGIIRKKLDPRESFITFGLGLLMSSFFTLPAIVELSYTSFSKIKISEISNYFASIELIGISSIVVLTLSLLVIYLNKFKENKETYLFIIISALSIFLSLNISDVVWKFLPSSLIQFPFRILSYLVVSSAFLSAYVLRSATKKKLAILFVFGTSIIVSSFPFLGPKVFFDKGDSFYSTNEATTTVKDEYTPYWVLEKPNKHFEKKVEILNSNQDVSGLTYNSKRIYFETAGESDRKVRINTIYYPGWNARVNGPNSNIMFDNSKGLMEINLPKGRNRVELIFSETPLRMASDLISVFAFVALLFWTRKSLFNSKITRRKNEKI